MLLIYTSVCSVLKMVYVAVILFYRDQQKKPDILRERFLLEAKFSNVNISLTYRNFYMS